MNYVGKAANIYDTGYQLKGSAYVISKYVSNTWLWDRVRVSGGAYGGFCDFDTHSGTNECHVMSMHSLKRLHCIYCQIYLCRSVLIPVLSGPQFAEDAGCI